MRIRIRIQEGNKDPQKWKEQKVKEVSCFEVLHVLFGGLKAPPVAGMVLHELQFDHKNLDFFSFKFLQNPSSSSSDKIVGPELDTDPH
jgi:hypothetical protein